MRNTNNNAETHYYTYYYCLKFVSLLQLFGNSNRGLKSEKRCDLEYFFQQTAVKLVGKLLYYDFLGFYLHPTQLVIRVLRIGYYRAIMVGHKS